MLLEGELDVDSDGATSGFMRATVSGFHDAGTAAGDNGEAEFGELGAHGAGEFVVGGAGLGAGGAENGDGGAGEVKAAEGFDEVPGDTENGKKFLNARLRAREERAIGGFEFELKLLANGGFVDGVFGGGFGTIRAVGSGHESQS